MPDRFSTAFGLDAKAIADLTGVQARTLKGYARGRQARPDVVARLASGLSISKAEVYRALSIVASDAEATR